MEPCATEKCEARGCENDAISYTDDGDHLCEDCLFEWVTEDYPTWEEEE